MDKFKKIIKICWIIEIILFLITTIMLMIWTDITLKIGCATGDFASIVLLPLIIATIVYNKKKNKIKSESKQINSKSKTQIQPKITIKQNKCEYCGIKLKNNETRCPNCNAIIKN